MLKKIFGLGIVQLLLLQVAWSQTDKNCCDKKDCREQTIEYATRITGLVNYLGSCSEDSAANNTVLRNLSNTYPTIHNDFIRTAKEIADRYIDHPRFADSRTCFFNSLPPNQAANVLAWINYINPKTPVFPSTEFCYGFSRRFEIGQGASAFLSKSYMEYLGSIRGFLVYTFKSKQECGGNFRLMTGPGYYLRSSDSYITLHSRAAVRIKDLKANVFNLGNINFFGGYITNFDHFNYAEAGLEVELGAFGLNLAANYDTNIKRAGFLIGLIIANKKL